MVTEIKEFPPDDLAIYGQIPIRFVVRTIFEIEGNDLDAAALIERPVARPWVKDYDAGPGEGPLSWEKRWDIANWGLLAAAIDGRLVGGCVLAYRTPRVDMLTGREDLAVMWDIRVNPDHRRSGIGRQLFDAALSWARDRDCRELRVETQNINVPACRFYAQQGCHLFSIDRHAYPDFPQEIQLIWQLKINNQ